MLRPMLRAVASLDCSLSSKVFCERGVCSGLLMSSTSTSFGDGSGSGSGPVGAGSTRGSGGITRFDLTRRKRFSASNINEDRCEVRSWLLSVVPNGKAELKFSRERLGPDPEGSSPICEKVHTVE